MFIIRVYCRILVYLLCFVILLILRTSFLQLSEKFLTVSREKGALQEQVAQVHEIRFFLSVCFLKLIYMYTSVIIIMCTNYVYNDSRTIEISLKL